MFNRDEVSKIRRGICHSPPQKLDSSSRRRCQARARRAFRSVGDNAYPHLRALRHTGFKKYNHQQADGVQQR
jgi:hypothetical protein